jgi:membrane-bound lytic murein transglycosylase D
MGFISGMKRTSLALAALLAGTACWASAQDGAAALATSATAASSFAGADVSDTSGQAGSAASAVTDLEPGPAETTKGEHSSEADDILARADKHFHTGRQLYFDGDLAAAHREFDAAVEILLSAPESLPDRDRIERRLDDLCDLIYRFDVEKLGAGEVQEADAEFDKAPIDELSHMTFPVDPSLAPKLESELHQTSSGIPLELADPVVSYVHYFSTERGRSILLAGFRRSGRYKEMIERIFAEEGVPQELMYVAQAESGFLPRAVSVKRAVGMWQFTGAAAMDHSLLRTASYDERLDPEIATRAAAKYLKSLYARYGDWYLAMAAYDCGPGVVDKAVERTGYADYWELVKRHALPKETANYVPIIVAMTIMAKNPKDYGLDDIELDPAVQYDTIRLEAPTNINLIADAAMQPVSVIRDLNPALLKTIAPAGISVHVPKGLGDATLSALETVPAANRVAWRLHRVEAGDTLAAVARAYHLSPERIVEVNRGAESLEAGDVLLIPAAYHPETHARARKAHVPRTGSKLASNHATAHTASHGVSPRVLHRKAVVRTASLQ